MPDGNIDYSHAKNQAEGCIQHAVQTREARAADPLEETDQTKVTHCTGDKRHCQQKGKPGYPSRGNVRHDESGARCDEQSTQREGNCNAERGGG